MIENLEIELRGLFIHEAERAPAPGISAEATLRRLRRRQRRRRLSVAAATGIAALSLAALMADMSDRQSSGQLAALEPETSRPLPEHGNASCVEDYSVSAVAGRGFAFDGTVTSIDAQRTSFVVHEWFIGGRAAAVTVTMSPSNVDRTLDEFKPAYQVGSRLLVSGERLPGDGLAGWGCGFTRYYGEEAADGWRAALDGVERAG